MDCITAHANHNWPFPKMGRQFRPMLLRGLFTEEERMKTKYQFKIKLKNGGIEYVTIEADNSGNARAMVETQYGSGCIMTGPTVVR